MNKIENFRNYQRHQFDASSKDDLKLVRKYLHTHSWGNEGCPFHLEWPYLDVPNMIKDKITHYTLKGLK
jgi:hypothetical protein